MPETLINFLAIIRMSMIYKAWWVDSTRTLSYLGQYPKKSYFRVF